MLLAVGAIIILAVYLGAVFILRLPPLVALLGVITGPIVLYLALGFHPR